LIVQQTKLLPDRREKRMKDKKIQGEVLGRGKAHSGYLSGVERKEIGSCCRIVED